MTSRENEPQQKNPLDPNNPVEPAPPTKNPSGAGTSADGEFDVESDETLAGGEDPGELQGDDPGSGGS